MRVRACGDAAREVNRFRARFGSGSFVVSSEIVTCPSNLESCVAALSQRGSGGARREETEVDGKSFLMTACRACPELGQGKQVNSPG